MVMQVAAFRAGFEEVFPLSSLNAFYADEIEAMLCGTGGCLTSRARGQTRCMRDTHAQHGPQQQCLGCHKR